MSKIERRVDLMTVTHERFVQGMTYAAYKAQMTRNRERLEENERAVRLEPADLAYFKGLQRPLRVLVLVEDWCGDVINNLPVLARMAEESATLDLRIFLRDQNLDLIDQYLNQGLHRSIPVFAFFDEDMRPIGHWIERPARIAELMAELRRGLWAGDPAFARPASCPRPRACASPPPSPSSGSPIAIWPIAR
jgi:Thioredoxin